MTRYKLGRRIATIVSLLGWVFVGISVLYFGFAVFVIGSAMGPSASMPLLSMTQLLIAGVPILAGALLFILLGHVVRAVFDMADAAVSSESD